MEEYKRIYDIYIQKSDDELREIINPKNGYSRTAVEVAWDILCYERRVEDLGFDDFEDLLKHHDMSLEKNKGTLRESFSKGSQMILKMAGIVILLVVIYPLGMYFLWKNKKYDKQFKVIESICCFGLWILLNVFVAEQINNMADSWRVGSKVENVFAGTLEVKDSEGKIWITTDDLKTIEILPDPNEKSGDYIIQMLFTQEGAEKFANVTSENIGNALHIYVNGECVFSPTVIGCISSGQVQIAINSLSTAKAIVNTIKNVEDNRDIIEQKSEKIETEKPKTKDETTPIDFETSAPEPDGVSGEQSKENDVVATEERQISKLLLDGNNIIDSTISDMKQYDYITDIAIEVDESRKNINIVVQVIYSIDKDTAKMAGEDVARYLAFCASVSNSYYSVPSNTDIGGIYKTYNLILYVDDGAGTFNMYGAKAKTAKSITWQ